MRHLYGLFKDLRPNEAYHDRYGWYLIYDDSNYGREKLRNCYKHFNKGLLFNEYPLEMNCFPNGTQEDEQRDRDASSKRNIGASAQGQPVATTSPKFGSLEGREVIYPGPRHGRSSAGAPLISTWWDERIDSTRVPDDEVGNAALSRSAPQKHAQPFMSSDIAGSQLSLRSDRDDTASLASGVTPSDGSRRKRCKCHVCQGDGGHGLSTLVHCATCPRRFHRRCHKDPPIPEQLPDGHHWSCRSCTRKGKALKEGSQRDTATPLSSLGPAFSQRQALQHRPNAIAASGGGQYDGSMSPISKPQHQKPLSTNAKTTEGDSQKAPSEPLKPNAVDSPVRAENDRDDDDAPLSDADDLVERSFASAEKRASSQPQPLRPSKLKMTRKKLSPSASAIVGQQASPLRTSMSAHSLSKDDELNSNVEVPAPRLSAATLRDLALDRHRASKADGADLGSSGQEPRPVNSSAADIRDRNASTDAIADIESRPMAREIPDDTDKDAGSTVTRRALDQLEIPESPDDVRKGEVKRMQQTEDPRLLAKRQFSMDRLSADDAVDKSSADVSQRATSHQPGTQNLAKRSRGPTFTVCQGCMKKTPIGPSGKNKLCTLCKKKEAAEARSFTTDVSAAHNSLAETVEAQDEPNKLAARTATPATNIEPMITDQTNEGLASLPANGNDDRRRTALFDKATTAMIDKDGDIKMASTKPGQEELFTALNEGFQPNPIASTQRGQTLQRDNEPVRNVDDQQTGEGTGPPVRSASKISPDKLTEIRKLLGDSFQRPKGSRAILVGMALCSAPNNRMQAKSITHWIGENIPTYRHGEGNWYARIVSQLSQGRTTDTGHGLRYWRDGGWNPGDEGTPGLRWYELLPEREEMMWKWCPVLKEPLAPKKPKVANVKNDGKKRRAPQKSAPVKMPSDQEPLDNRAEEEAMNEATKEHGASGHNQDATGSANPESRLQMHRGGVREATQRQGEISSDDEPIYKMRRRSSAAQSSHVGCDVAKHDTPIHAETGELPDAESGVPAASTVTRNEDIDRDTATKVPDAPDLPKRSGLVKLRVPSLHNKVPDRLVPSDVVLTDKLDTPSAQDKGLRSGPAMPGQYCTSSMQDKDLRSKNATDDFSVTSFFDEWPEYRSANAFDEQDKLKEIRERPTRKQMFGKPASHSRLRSEGTLPILLIIPNTMSPAKRTRPLFDATLNDPYPWENPDVDPTLKEYKTLDDFFDLPANMIPIISEGQLAYRDGTRTDDGRLPRAREVFKP